MSWTPPRTENNTRRAAVSATAGRGIFDRVSCATAVQLGLRLACGLLAAMHIAPLLRISRHVLEQGPTPALASSWAALVLLIGVLAAKAAGLVFFSAGSRRVSLIAFVAAAAIFHGDVIVNKDIAPTTVAVLSATGAAAAVPVLRRVRDNLAGAGFSFKDLFPTTIWARLIGEPSPAPLCIAGPRSAQPRGPPVSTLPA